VKKGTIITLALENIHTPAKIVL